LRPGFCACEWGEERKADSPCARLKGKKKTSCFNHFQKRKKKKKGEKTPRVQLCRRKAEIHRNLREEKKEKGGGGGKIFRASERENTGLPQIEGKKGEKKQQLSIVCLGGREKTTRPYRKEEKPDLPFPPLHN